MIRKLLIANRGEIALRIMRACRELDVASVAVYSDADAGAPHVQYADQAIRIGAAPSAASYLDAAAILGAAQIAKADAIHPGYGFLSENAAFAALCERAGLVFVGPPAEVIRRMGSKIEARRLMQDAGVPVVPGDTPADQSDAGVARVIAAIGLPVLVKASAGGGGKGMRAVRDGAETLAAIQAARREAVAAFGDGTLYVERLLEQPHHVEVQVFADALGGSVHLFERECSVQRRHQKVIEESPSPSIGADLRTRLTAAGLRAARAAGYVNAGTIEFLVDVAEQSFYFLEMNTRLQVEHPVTEAVTGVDLVRAQILVAGGQPLPWREQDLSQRGHAIEARIYAEDPDRGFLPQAGRLLLYREPRRPGIRIDSGVAEGDEVSVHYDPMLAKVVASAETRPLAIARLAAALREFPILGIRTNIPFLLRILDHARFRDGTMDTAFLDRESASLSATTDHTMPAPVRAAIDAVHLPSAPTSWDPWSTPVGPSFSSGAPSFSSGAPSFSSGAPSFSSVGPSFSSVGPSFSSVGPSFSSGAPSFSSGAADVSPGAPAIARAEARAYSQGDYHGVYIVRSGKTTWAFCDGHVYTETSPDARASRPASRPPVQDASSGEDPAPAQTRSLAAPGAGAGASAIAAPMPGTVLSVLVSSGAAVAKGDTVVILEAMKMELPLVALDAGIVSVVRCKVGDLVDADAILVEFEAGRRS